MIDENISVQAISGELLGGGTSGGGASSSTDSSSSSEDSKIKVFLPKESLKQIDPLTGQVNYIYPLTIDKQVVLEDNTRLNEKIAQLNTTIAELNSLLTQVQRDLRTAQTTANEATTKADNAQATANNAIPKHIGFKPISSPSDDTVLNWINKGTGIAWYSSWNCINGQPSQYGFLLNICFPDISDIRQIWCAQRNGDIYFRGGNGSGFSGWYRLMNNTNFNFSNGTLNISV